MPPKPSTVRSDQGRIVRQPFIVKHQIIHSCFVFSFPLIWMKELAKFSSKLKTEQRPKHPLLPRPSKMLKLPDSAKYSLLSNKSMCSSSRPECFALSRTVSLLFSAPCGDINPSAIWGSSASSVELYLPGSPHTGHEPPQG